MVLDDAQGRYELAAAVITRTPVAGADLRASLAEELPAAMVPTRVLVVDALPRTANGKADRRAGARMVRDFADPGDGGTRTRP
ncbi:amino acid adenylation domain-containing protein [Streptomyces californicus]